MSPRSFSRALTILAAAILAVLPILSAQQPSSSPPLTNRPVPDAPAARPAPSLPQPAEVSAPLPSVSSSSSMSSTRAPYRYFSSPDPNAQVTVLENTLLPVLTNEPFDSRHTRPGAPLSFTLSDDVIVDSVLIVPRGAALEGAVVDSKQPGTLAGGAQLTLKLTSLSFGGRTYPLYSYQFRVQGTSKSGPTKSKAASGAVIGAIALGVLSRTPAEHAIGAATGAAVGAGVGTAVSAATPGPVLFIPAESEIDFSLASPISVVPTTRQEADRLSQGLHSGGPVLYVRGDTP